MIERDILEKIESRGLPCPFTATSSGEVSTTGSGEALIEKFSHTATVLFETINAVGDVKIDTLEILGEKKSLIIEFEDDFLVGTLFDSRAGLDVSQLYNLLEELKGKPEAEAEEKPGSVMGPELLDKIKAVMSDYLGDFTERIYKNQLKTQKINPDELYEDDIRRFIFALGKAAGMVIGPSRGASLTNKLLELVK